MNKIRFFVAVVAAKIVLLRKMLRTLIVREPGLLRRASLAQGRQGHAVATMVRENIQE